MKKLLFVIVITVILVGLSTTVTFGSAYFFVKQGISGYGARATAMGGAFVAVADDGFAPYYNPAGITQLKAPVIAGDIGIAKGNHSDYLAFSGFGGITTPSWACNVCFDHASVRDEPYPGSNGTYNLVLSGAITQDESVSFGGNAKIVYDYQSDSYASEAGFGIAFDIGMLLRQSKYFSYGFVGRDIGMQGFPSFTAGLGYKPTSSTTIAFDLEITRPMGDFISFPTFLCHLGAEQTILHDLLALRLGVSTIYIFPFFTGGLGFKLFGIDADIAVVGLVTGGPEVEISCSYKY